MAFYDTNWYVNSVAYAAIPVWTASQTWTVGTLRRQVSPAVGAERVFVCIVAGAGSTGSEPTWVITRGGKSVDFLATWQECTGATAVNGDVANTPTWAIAKATGTPTLGAIIQRNSGASFQICSTAGTLSASEPAFSNTAGVTTADGTTVWTCIGTSFAAWAAPFARLSAADTATWGVAGNDFWLADNHSETSTVSILYNLGTVAAPCRAISIDHTLSLPATAASLKVGAIIASSMAANVGLGIGTVGSVSQYWYGVSFVQSGAINAILILVGGGTAGNLRFDSCSFQLSSVTSGASMSVGAGAAGAGGIDLNNCTFSFGNSGQFLTMANGVINWRNTPNPSLLGTIPTTLLRPNNSGSSILLCEGVDLTALGANTLVVNTLGGIGFTFKNCKLHSGAIVAAMASTSLPFTIDLIDCDSGATNYRNERHNYHGDLTTSITYYRTGGATDGVTPVSHQAITTLFPKNWRPFLMLPLVIWNDVVGTTRTVTLYGILQNAGRLPYNDEFWFDVEYMGDSGSPLASLASCGKATELTTHSQVAVADAISVWNGSPTSPTPFSVAVTFTAQQKGYLTVYPKIGAPSLTFLIDPRPVLT